MNFTDLGYYFSLAIGLATFIIGILAVLKPQPMSEKFGIAAGKPALPYVIATGIRDVFIGLTVFILFYMQHWQALGAVILSSGIVAICDFIVVQKYGDKKTSYMHLAGTIIVTAYGIWLI